MSQIEVLFLSQKDVKACAPSPQDMFQIVEDVFQAHGRQQVMHRKVHLDLRDRHKGHFAAFPAYLETAAGTIAGIKWLGNFVDNPAELSLPSVTALTIINDTSTGLPLAIMDGGYITALRTAAASAVGAKFLARANTSVAAVVGASVQGREHLIALHELFGLKAARVYDVIDRVKQDYARAMERQLGLAVMPATSCEEAVLGSDIVVTATTAR